MHIIKTLCVACLLGIVFHLSAHADEYTIRQENDSKEALAADILLLALKKVDPNAVLTPKGDPAMTEARLMDAVDNNEIDIFWAGASAEKEARMLTVRIPILKGLLGHRIFIVRKEDKDAFINVRTIADLAKFNAGQGTFWGDTKVLQNANIPTVTTIKYLNLFPMLEGGRFDYFPRAVHEPWVEVETRPELNLMVEQNIMLIYPYAMYFFVNKNNQALHEKIYRGFEMAVQDGSFDTLFFAHPMIKDALSKAKLENRHSIRIGNPFMHPDTPTDRPEFWLDLSKL